MRGSMPNAALGRELKELLRLALPLSIGYAGASLLGFVDTAMVGRLGKAALGAVGIGNGVFFALCLVGMGLISGADPIIAQAVGAGEDETARRVLWQSVRLALYLSLPLFVVLFAIAMALERFGIDPEIAGPTRAFLLGRFLNAPPFLLFAACRGYLQAHGATRAIVVSTVVANVLNFLLDAVFIFGDRALEAVHLPAIGLPAMGVFGAGLASTLASFASTAVVARAIAAIPVDGSSARGQAKTHRAHDPVLFAKTLRLGTPIALQLFAEVGAFTLATFFCGRMGALPVASHHVALSLASFTFTAAIGVAAATTVQVGKAVGRGDTPAARRAGFSGVAVGLAFMGACGLTFFFAPAACAGVLTDQPDVIAGAVPLLGIAALFQLSDGAQGIFAAALRGCGDTRFAQHANVFGHYAVGVPIAVGLGFYAGLGARGVWWGLFAGLTVVAILLAGRFDRLTRGAIARA
jgi:multidrug resistance protein, MATE family